MRTFPYLIFCGCEKPFKSHEALVKGTRVSKILECMGKTQFSSALKVQYFSDIFDKFWQHMFYKC